MLVGKERRGEHPVHVLYVKAMEIPRPPFASDAILLLPQLTLEDVSWGTAILDPSNRCIAIVKKF